MLIAATSVLTWTLSLLIAACHESLNPRSPTPPTSRRRFLNDSQSVAGVIACLDTME